MNGSAILQTLAPVTHDLGGFKVHRTLPHKQHLLQSRHLVLLAPSHRPLLKSKRGARLMLCGGAPMDGERHVWWNFVSSNRERIDEAKRAWKAGEFELPPDDSEEFIPLPEVPTTVSYP